MSFGTATGAYSDVATYWAVVDSAGLLCYWDDLAPDQVVEVDAATASPVTISPSIFFEDGA